VAGMKVQGWMPGTTPISGLMTITSSLMKDINNQIHEFIKNNIDT